MRASIASKQSAFAPEPACCICATPRRSCADRRREATRSRQPRTQGPESRANAVSPRATRARPCPPPQIISSGRLPRGAGNARSMAATARVQHEVRATRDSRGRAPTRAALGITTTSGARSNHARASCAGVAPARAATAASAGCRASAPLVERRVRHDGDAAACAPRQQVELDAAAREVVEHLVGRDLARRRAPPPALPGRRRRSSTRPSGGSCPARTRSLERLDGLRERRRLPRQCSR